MPIIDFYYPAGCFSLEQQQQLAENLTSSLQKCAHATNSPRANRLNWLYLHELPAKKIFIAGKPESKPHYRVEVSVMAGMMDEGLRAEIAEDMTHKVLEAEGAPFNPMSAGRVWVIFQEIPEGQWAAAGRLYRAQDLISYLDQ